MSSGSACANVATNSRTFMAAQFLSTSRQVFIDSQSNGALARNETTSIVITKRKLSTLGSDTFWCFLSEHWTHVDRLFTKPTVPDLIGDPLAGRKRAKLDATQGGFSKRHLLPVITANHAPFLVSIKVQDHSLHVSCSCLFPNWHKSLLLIDRRTHCPEERSGIRSQGALQLGVLARSYTAPNSRTLADLTSSR